MKWYEVRKSWDWWRHNHFMSRWASAKMVFRSTVIWPIENIYAWVWMHTIMRIQMRKLRKRMKELEIKSEDLG